MKYNTESSRLSLTVSSTWTPTAAMPSAFYWPLLVPCALRAPAPVNSFVRSCSGPAEPFGQFNRRRVMQLLSRSQFRPSSSPEAFRDLCASKEEWLVRSQVDATQLAESEYSPWRGVPKEAVKAFVQTLEFKNGGLAHCNYSSLEPHMTVKDFMTMWEHFGIGRELVMRWADKQCARPGTCTYCNGCVCTSNC